MKFSPRNASILILGTISALPLVVNAEVKSLSSSELTETYIQDSTIIVTPKKQTRTTQQKQVTNLTISPQDVSESELGEIEHSQNHMSGTRTAFELSDELMRNTAVNDAVALVTTPQPYVPSFDEINAPLPISEILNDDRFAVPEGDQWAQVYLGNAENGLPDLGIALDGDQYTMSFGNLPGINNIHIPESINEGPVELVPRPGGGFDLTITLPQD
jgi:hypothetical protein